jgi:hypothetical protein
VILDSDPKPDRPLVFPGWTDALAAASLPPEQRHAFAVTVR